MERDEIRIRRARILKIGQQIRIASVLIEQVYKNMDDVERKKFDWEKLREHHKECDKLSRKLLETYRPKS